MTKEEIKLIQKAVLKWSEGPCPSPSVPEVVDRTILEILARYQIVPFEVIGLEEAELLEEPVRKGRLCTRPELVIDDGDDEC